ncbi:MAG: hypothetical protein V3U80_00710 [Flavobacteriaceae bacterium]
MKKLIVVSVILLLIASCSKKQKVYKVSEEPSKVIMNSLQGSDYSIVLNDMDIEKNNKMLTYKHKYHVLKKTKDTLTIDSLQWQPVNETFFNKYKDDLGMEIISNHNGKLSTVSQPVGYGWAIGNPKEGEWVEEKIDSTKKDSETRRVWRPRGTSMLFWYWMLRRPAYQRDYRYSRSYRSSGKVYRGTNSKTGTSRFGTNSTYQKSKRAPFYKRSSTSSTWRNFKTKTSKSSSRYKKSSRTRSRSGGFGK